MPDDLICHYGKWVNQRITKTQDSLLPEVIHMSILPTTASTFMWPPVAYMWENQVE